MPAHSFEIVFYGDTASSDEIAQAIWDSQPAGIAAVHGTAGIAGNGTAQDILGTDHSVAFTSASAVDTYYSVDVLVDPLTYPLDGDEQVKEALAAFINGRSQSIGMDVTVSRLFGSIYAAVPGILDITEIRLGLAPSPPDSTFIDIGTREIAKTDTANIEVSSTNG